MTLTEITKGMSNAAEAIEANFQTGSILESGSNANGTYMKFGDGTMIVTSDVVFGTALSQNFTLPDTFVGSFGITLSARSADPWTLQDVSIIGAGKASQNTITLRMSEQVKRKTDYAMPLMIMCIGRWK